jgi:nucleotide-binding universal stress UspA family protein
MKILVATDGSRGGIAAVNFATRLAARDAGTDLIVLTVDPANGDGAAVPGQTGEDDPSRAGRAQGVIDAAAQEVSRRGGRARFQIVAADRRDEIPEVISREADRLKADLVVVGSEGRDTLNEWVVGGVALRLIYVSRRPVTVVRPRRRRVG